MGKIAIVVHGGAGSIDEFTKKNEKGYKEGLEESVKAGYTVLERGGTSVEAVEAAVRVLEDNPLFNAGKGSAFTEKGTIEMCACIADGNSSRSGAAAIVKNVKNPVTLARKVMDNPKNCYLGNQGALDFAKNEGLEIMPDDYFFTEHQYEELEKSRQSEPHEYHGTVGAVAVDREGNVAAATSTGGTPNARLGRIGDSSMFGVGAYAKNSTCAISSTGDGEYLVQAVVCHDVSALMEYKGMDVKEACRHEIHERLKNIDGDAGIIAVDAKGNIAMEFNSDRMFRGWKTEDGDSGTALYKND